MKILIIQAALLFAAIAGKSYADGDPVDPLTKLPLPAAGAPIALRGAAMRLPDVPVCSAKGTMNFYTAGKGTVNAAVAWYSSHLVGFKHVHGFGSGRSQDTFYNGAGTVTVSITGEEGKDGKDANIYSVIYATIQPGVSDKAIAGMNVQKVTCP